MRVREGGSRPGTALTCLSLPIKLISHMRPAQPFDKALSVMFSIAGPEAAR